MASLVQMTRFVGIVFITGLLAIIAIQFLTGQIRTRYLLFGVRSDGSRYFSPERVQLLLFTLAAAFDCLSTALKSPTPGTFPQISETWVALLGGSQALFLGGKSYFLTKWRPSKSEK